MTADTRALLERTGHLYTNDPQDVGHIPEFWRKRIYDLCKALEAAPLDVAEQLEAECRAHADTRADLESARAARSSFAQQLAAKEDELSRTAEKAAAGVRLVEEAVPRMRTLNNAMSPDWLSRAAAFLEA